MKRKGIHDVGLNTLETENHARSNKRDTLLEPSGGHSRSRTKLTISGAIQ